MARRSPDGEGINWSSLPKSAKRGIKTAGVITAVALAAPTESQHVAPDAIRTVANAIEQPFEGALGVEQHNPDYDTVKLDGRTHDIPREVAAQTIDNAVNTAIVDSQLDSGN